MGSRVSVIVLGYGPEPYLEHCLDAIASELPADGEIVLVDNGVGPRPAGSAPFPGQVRIVGDGANLGFAGGCDLGAARATGDVLVFANSDAIVRPGSLAPLVGVAEAAEVGIASGSLRLADAPDLINSAGNPLHFLGLTWAGGCGEPASRHATACDVAVCTGGFFAVRREVWEALGGFDPTYFAYHEDTDLSVRCWLAGWRVRYVPEAVADHHYDFGRNPRKMYLLERNRLLTVLTDYPSGLLLAVAPALLVTEPLFLVLAVLQGWPRQKLEAWGWALSHLSLVRHRRRRVQRAVRRGPDVVALRMAARIEPPMVSPPPGMGLVNLALSAYWRVALRTLLRGTGTPGSAEAPGPTPGSTLTPGSPT
ncbi:Glycosyltransferase, GT2 family [Pedococcus cremeus]|uniref:Glycosyltransferase, GT2 family n=1 Tax=Pedococcus cremeus TaxID=587636 RepID=A0A1H9XAR5_9MICO|nr:glycosyltransferase family 2 protein [Pedococcus cremeus]SES43225.1 Glycosyltransferase, GT2 family [Pedococcus cremeus]